MTELEKDSDRLYTLGCILNLTGHLYRTCLNWNDCSENVFCDDCYEVCWQGWEAIYQFQHNENELLGYYPELKPLQSFIASKPDDNIKDVSKPTGKQWLSDWGLALELAGLFDRGREFCRSLMQIVKQPESKTSIDKWKEWQHLGCVKKFYDSTFELSKKLYQTPLRSIAYCDAKANPEIRLSVLFCLLKEFRQMFIKHMTVNGPYNLNHGAFGGLGEFREEKAFGTLAIAPLGKIIHCQFKAQDSEKFDWDIITRGWAKYEQRLFDTWSYETGEYFKNSRVKDSAIWFMEPICQDLFNKMASDIEKISIPLLAFDEYRQEIESVLRINRNGSAKWYPCKIEWTYLKKLDSVINGIRTKGNLLEIEVLRKQSESAKQSLAKPKTETGPERDVEILSGPLANNLYELAKQVEDADYLVRNEDTKEETVLHGYSEKTVRAIQRAVHSEKKLHPVIEEVLGIEEAEDFLFDLRMVLHFSDFDEITKSGEIRTKFRPDHPKPWRKGCTEGKKLANRIRRYAGLVDNKATEAKQPTPQNQTESQQVKPDGKIESMKHEVRADLKDISNTVIHLLELAEMFYEKDRRWGDWWHTIMRPGSNLFRDGEIRHVAERLYSEGKSTAAGLWEILPTINNIKTCPKLKGYVDDIRAAQKNWINEDSELISKVKAVISKYEGKYDLGDLEIMLRWHKEALDTLRGLDTELAQIENSERYKIENALSVAEPPAIKPQVEKVHRQSAGAESGHEKEELLLLNRALDESIGIANYLHLIRTKCLNKKTVIVDIQSVSELSAYLLCLLYDIHKQKRIDSPYTENLSYRVEEHFNLGEELVSNIPNLRKAERTKRNYEASAFWACVLKKDLPNAEQVMNTITKSLKNNSWEYEIEKEKLKEYVNSTCRKLETIVRLLDRFLNDYISEEHSGLWAKSVLYRLRKIRNIVVYSSWATGPYLLSTGKDWAVGVIGNRIDNLNGYLSVRFFSFTKGVKCQFVPADTKEAEEKSWVVNPLKLNTSTPLCSGEDFCYETKLFETWIGESGQYYSHPEIKQTAYWEIEATTAIVLEEESSTAQWAIEKMGNNKGYEKLADKSRNCLRNGNSRWQPTHLEWSYVNRLDNLIVEFDKQIKKTVARTEAEAEKKVQKTNGGNEGETPVTLREFMINYCEPVSNNIRESRVKSLQGLAQKKVITLEHTGKWVSGKSKYYLPKYLISNWETIRNKLPSLPKLKQP